MSESEKIYETEREVEMHCGHLSLMYFELWTYVSVEKSQKREAFSGIIRKYHALKMTEL